MASIDVAWWNLENLYDHEGADRDPRLASQLASELRGWTEALRDRKLDQLASIIVQMFGGQGPDLLGVCEVEDEAVLELLALRLGLPGRDYRVLHHDSADTRGIDCSFIFDAATLAPMASGHQVVVKRSPTRDIFWGRFAHPATGNELVAVANHWPARSFGRLESEPFRMLTGETLSVVLEDLRGDDAHTPILAMGDFNDQPFDRSMREYLLGSRDRGRVVRARNPMVLNLMWPLLFRGDPGSFRYGSDWYMFDQVLATKGLLVLSSPIRVDRDSVAVFRPPEMSGRGGRPMGFGRPSRRLDRDGYSDHYPITVRVDLG